MTLSEGWRGRGGPSKHPARSGRRDKHLEESGTQLADSWNFVLRFLATCGRELCCARRCCPRFARREGRKPRGTSERSKTTATPTPTDWWVHNAALWCQQIVYNLITKLYVPVKWVDQLIDRLLNYFLAASWKKKNSTEIKWSVNESDRKMICSSLCRLKDLLSFCEWKWQKSDVFFKCITANQTRD